jgi:hypothetical protein
MTEELKACGELRKAATAYEKAVETGNSTAEMLAYAEYARLKGKQERAASSQNGLVEKFREHIKAIPMGAENVGHGQSEYNWGVHYLHVLEALAKHRRETTSAVRSGCI